MRAPLGSRSPCSKLKLKGAGIEERPRNLFPTRQLLSGLEARPSSPLAFEQRAVASLLETFLASAGHRPKRRIMNIEVVSLCNPDSLDWNKIAV